MRAIRPYLVQGDIRDLNLLNEPEVRKKYAFTLAINVGSTNFLPKNMFAVHLPMMDGERREDNDWDAILVVADVAVAEIARGGKVFVSCDAGLSRSVVFAAMVIALYEDRPMDDALMAEVGGDPLLGLWRTAHEYLDVEPFMPNL